MEKIANTTEKVATNSDLSQFVGADVMVGGLQPHIPRSLTNLVEADVTDWANRLLSYDELIGFPEGITLGPSLSGSNGTFNILRFFRNYPPFSTPVQFYKGLVYDSVEVRFTVSEPKNLVGALFCSWWPYTDWYDKNNQETFDVVTADPTNGSILYQYWINNPNTTMLPLGMSKEVTFTIPWSFKQPYIDTQVVWLDESTPDKRPLYGTPHVWWILGEGSSYITSVENPARLHIFCKFNGLRWLGPGLFDDLSSLTAEPQGLPEEPACSLHDDADDYSCTDLSSWDSTEIKRYGLGFLEQIEETYDVAVDSTPNHYVYSELASEPDWFWQSDRNVTYSPWGEPMFSAQPQSGLGVAAAAEVATATATALGVEKVVETIDGVFDQESTAEISEYGTFDQPQAVQLAYLGDTTSCDYPKTSPIFSPHLNGVSPPVPSVHEMLSRPQYLGYFTSGDNQTLTNDPMRFNVDTAPFLGTYFRFFGMLNRYWRGTINFHFVICGHPMVQVQFMAKVYYNASLLPNTPSASIEFARHLSVFNSCKQIVVPMPFLCMNDYMPVDDRYPGNLPDIDAKNRTITTFCDVSLDIVSTMLNVAPVIPVYMFASAGPDFAFYLPRPPGLYHVDIGQLTKKPPPEERLDIPVTPQVFLPLDDEKEVMRTRHLATEDPGTLISLPTIYDYMKIWCRCVPFFDYDNDEDEEPTPDAAAGFMYPFWYPPIDRTADLDANNSWFFTLDYIAYLSTLFMYFKGEMGFKIVMASESRPLGGYVFAALGDPINRQLTHCPFPSADLQLPPSSNFGTGCVVTPQDKQPIIDLTIPYRGSNVWSYANANASLRPPAVLFGILPNAEVEHNIVLQGDDDVLADAMFRKIGPNFALAVECPLPPPTMWAARGFDWSS